jgi:hypothetical protein
MGGNCVSVASVVNDSRNVLPGSAGDVCSLLQSFFI